MLVSVKTPAEAAIVAAADGVTVVDVKDPSRGSLGFAGAVTINEIATEIANNKKEKLLSVALGELQSIDFDEVNRIDWSCVDFVKLGLSGFYDDLLWRSKLCKALANIPARVRRVLVLYVDQVEASVATEMIQDAKEAGLSVVLLDTFDKSRGNAFVHWTEDAVRRTFESAARRALTTVLAGSIGLPDLPRAFRTGADLIGVRGAVCDGDRSGSLSQQRLDRLITAYREVSV